MSINNSDMVVHIIHGAHVHTKSLANLSPDDYIQSQIDTIKGYANTLVQHKIGQRHLVICPEYFLTYKDKEHPGSTKEEYKKYLTGLSNIPAYVILVPGTCMRKKPVNSIYDDLLDLHTSLVQKNDTEDNTISQQIKNTVEQELDYHKPRLANKYPQLNSLANYRYQVYKKAFEKTNFQNIYAVSKVSSLNAINFIRNEYSKFDVNNIKQMNFVFNTLNVIYNKKNVYKYNKRSFWNEKKSQTDSIYMPLNLNYGHTLTLDNQINFSFEICFDHRLKIRYNDIKNNQAKPSDYHIVLSDSVNSDFNTYLAPYLIHSSTDILNSGLFVWDNSSYVKHYPCSHTSILNSKTNTRYQVHIHYSYSYTDKQNLNDNVNLLFSALNDNDVDAVTNCIKQILSVNLSHGEKEKVLAAKDSDGTPGLFIALQDGFAEAVKAYIEGIRNTPMINKDILLAAKDSDGTSGLYMALQDGHAETVKAYIEGIKNIPTINKNVLLAAKDSDNVPGLYMALQNNHAEAVKAYIEGIKNISLINKDILLAAKDIDGKPGLFMPMQEGYAETVKAYVEGIKDIPMINKDILLAVKDIDGTPGLLMALQEGHTETVKAYIEGIKDIPMINKEILLAAKDSNGTPGLKLALQCNRAETIKAYIEGIKDIPEINKEKLLIARDSNGKPGLSAALQEGHDEATKAYIESIENIPGINKDILLIAKRKKMVRLN
ncbi:ankyrin repeat domain-containing protein [Allofrancisella frigidaquae]|uniref:Ankyrin repeat domain-containing protein n=1 Tax=Allofrancisella frigidaquae TaxID=1085644 RepID=A0A6M3HYM5_9GAMM|nr:hypothetical protein [Allofrancisella frigidaquae]QIV94766.1 ankyrin repeat domain-containing protein [Allofrancisella frigidaquae]